MSARLSSRARRWVVLALPIAIMIVGGAVEACSDFSAPSAGLDGGGSQEGGSGFDANVPIVTPDAEPSPFPILAPDAEPPRGCPPGCLPPPPQGWIGPVSVYDGPPTPAGQPERACPPPYTLKEVTAYQDLTSEQPTCTCKEGTVETAECRTMANFTNFPDCSSQFTSTIIVKAGDTCRPIPSPTRTPFVQIARPVFHGQGCKMDPPIVDKRPPQPRVENVACSLPERAECAGRSDCTSAPLPGSAQTRRCIYKEGYESCPSADYARRILSFQNIKDDRGCSTCFYGEFPTGRCTGDNAFQLSRDTNCTIPLETIPTGACHSLDDAGVALSLPFTPVPDGCKGTTSPTGSATLEGVVTFCCSQ